MRYNLARLYADQGQFNDAIDQLEFVVLGYTKVLGPDDRETIEASERLNSWNAN